MKAASDEEDVRGNPGKVSSSICDRDFRDWSFDNANFAEGFSGGFSVGSKDHQEVAAGTT